MSTNIPHTSPNYYILRQAIIFPEAGSLGVTEAQNQQLNITPMIPSFQIKEGMNQDMLTGYLDIYDSVGLLEKYPMRGEERLILEVEDAMQNVRVWDLFIYKIDNVNVSKINDLVMFKAHFITYQSFIAMNFIHTKAFKQMTVTDIAAKIFVDSYTPPGVTFPEIMVESRGEVFNKTKKDLVIEPSDGFVRVVIPKMNTQDTMDFLQRRAYSATSPSTAFRFFESSTSFNFVTDEYLFRKATDPSDPRVFEMTASDGIRRDGEQMFAEFNNLEHVVNSNRVDTLDDLYGGTYRNRVIELDTVRRIANLREIGYEYFNKRGQYFTNVVGEQLLDRHTREFIDFYSRPDNAKQFLIVKDYDDGEDVAEFQNRGQPHYKDIVSNRLPFRKHLNSITVNATGPGRIDIVAGDVINLTITEISASGSIQNNPQLTGNYLVKELVRDFVAEEGRNHYIIVKMDWGVNSSGNDPIGESGALSVLSKLKKLTGI